MEKRKVKDLFKYLPKAKHKAGEGLEAGEYPFYTSSAVVNKYFNEYDYEPNKLIFATGGSASVHYANSRFAVSTDNFILEPNDGINAKYVYYYLKSNIGILQNGFHGAGLQHLSKDYLNDIDIPVVSSDQQQKIVDILDKADEIRTKKRLANDKLDEFLKSTFIDMFGDPVKNPKLFKVEKLEKHIKVIGGYAFKSSLFKEQGIPVLRIGNINTGKLRMDNVVYWEEDSTLAKYMLYPNDLVISLTGTVGKDDYGNVCILPSSCPCYYLNQRNAKLVVNDNINTYYLCHLLKNKDVKSKLTGISRGVRQANISNSDILNLEIALPPIEEQNKFAQIVEKVEEQKQKNEQVIELMDNLFNSLSQKAFKGEL